MATTYQNAAVVECLMCDAKNNPSALQCKECAAPMAILKDAVAQKRTPQIISILGDSNAGKTVYVGFLLDMLSQRADDFECIPKAAYGVELQQNVISHMAYRMFPPKTPMESNEWSWAYCQVRKRQRSRKWVDLIMPDLAGEAIAAEISSPETFRVIHNLLGMSEGALLLVDAALAANGSTKSDFFALKMLSYIDTMLGGNPEELVDIPVAVVLTKADHCPECFNDPRRFIEANLNRLWNMCDSRFRNVEYFACSVVGSLAYATTPQEEYVTPIPLHTALHGVLEPFEWILNQL